MFMAALNSCMLIWAIAVRVKTGKKLVSDTNK
jgi:hypothetical protein